MKKLFIVSLLLLTAAGCDIFGFGSGGTGPLGVIKTVDGGGAWQMYNRITEKSNISGLAVSEMFVDPNKHEKVFASSFNGGLWVTENSADNWNQILSAVNVYDFYVDPRDEKAIFAVGIFGDHGRILRTKDGGATWEEIYSEASINNPVNTITANPSNSNELYAALDTGVVIKSIDGGVNWFVVNDFQDQALKLRYLSTSNALYGYFRNKGLFKSTDGGQKWTPLTTALTKTGSTYLGQTFTPKEVDTFMKVGFDDQTAGVIYITTSNGIYKTTNEGQNWNFIFLPVKAEALYPRAIASTKGGMIAYTSIEDTIFKTLDGGQSWQTQPIPTGQLVNKIVIDPVKNQVVYLGVIAR